MASKARKIRVGLFTAVTGALVAIVVVVFGGLRFWEGRDRYTILFDGTVYGLETGANVYLNGMRVGKVTDIDAAPDDLRKVQVTVKIKEGTPIHTDTRATMQFAGITGLKNIDLRDGSLTAPMLPPGGTIAQGETTLDKLEQQAHTLADQSVQLMTRATQIVDNLVAITDPKRLEPMNEIMAQAKLAAGNLAASSATLKLIVSENRVALRQSIDAVGDVAKHTSALIDGQVGLLVTNAGDFVSELKGLVRDNGAILRTSMFDLRQASRSFKELVREVRQRPSRLLFSSAPSERKMP
jgi:phospholipid/cholesterol/gamma-HCH transport system substrate-binding protein